ncbi:peptidase [Paracoccus fistulariae]|uniref:Peptidase n=1 Tax=Paracoccus fistulariae TaxID=658446 RepID=A0ABY7SL16_9RHOB|nr:peptidase [Paracoccus fistulariae]MDB6181513.1 peptidase [Paracoccus fistulariae]WCR07549.1 peptidase [Paracoccus fistulariae]
MDKDVVELARGWIGTPYQHQASLRGVAADCLGLIRGLWRDLYGAEPEIAPAYSPDWGEVGRTEVLMQAAVRHLLPLPADADLEPGQVLLFRMRQGAIAKHLGVISQVGDLPRFIHAYNGHGVIDSPLTMPWRNRIAARFRFP